MNNATRFFLVLLRLVIGWHLLFAGLEKFAPDYRGSEGYLREASGPLASYYEMMLGDPVLDRLQVQGGLQDDEDFGPPALHSRFPKALGEEWEGYYEVFVRHYGLTAEQQEKARKLLDRAEDETTEWLLHGVKDVKKTSPYGPPIEMVKRTPDRIQDYKKKVAEVRAYQRGEYAFGMFTPFAADRARELQLQKADLANMRSALSKDLDDHTKQMKASLLTVLTDEQASRQPLPERVALGWSHMSRLDWIDFLVRWGLVVVGACLLLGLFSRTACLGGAFLLLSFYLAAMPVPGASEALRREGYPYINKNIVEMMALLTLATTASGRWVGLDAFLYFLNPFRRRVRPAQTPAVVPAARPAPAPSGPPPVVVHKEHIDLT